MLQAIYTIILEKMPEEMIGMPLFLKMARKLGLESEMV